MKCSQKDSYQNQACLYDLDTMKREQALGRGGSVPEQKIEAVPNSNCF